MGLLPASLLANLQSETPSCAWLLEVDHQNGTTLQYSQEGVTSLAEGHYAPWVKSFGPITRNLSTWRGGLQASTASADLDDTGGQFSRTYGRALRGAAARIKLVGWTYAGVATFHTVFSGKVDSVRKASNVVSLDLRVSDEALKVPLSRAPIRRNTFASLPSTSDALDKGVPVVFGPHDSAGFDALGMVKCPRVDTVQRHYLVTMGWDATVTRAFVDGVLKNQSTDYTVEEILSGDSRKVTVLEFSVAADPEDLEVLVDVEVTADTPAEQLATLLVDHCFNDYHLGSFDAAGAPISSATFTALDKLLDTSLGIACSYYMPIERKQGLEIVRDFLDTFDALAYWTNDGKLAVTHWEYRTQEASVYATRVLDESQMLSVPSFTQDPQSVVNRLLAKSGLRSSTGDYINQRTVRIGDSTDTPENAGETNQSWLVATSDAIAGTTTLSPDSTTSNTAWNLGGGAASIHDGLADYAGTKYIRSTASTNCATVVTLSAMPDLVSVESVRIECEVSGVNAISGDDDTLDFALVIGGTSYAGYSQGGTGPFFRPVVGGTWLISPATGLKFTQAELNGLSVQLGFDPQNTTATNPTKAVDVRRLKVIPTYTASAAISPATLTLASKRVNRFVQAPQVMTVRVPLEWIDCELGEQVAVGDRREGWNATAYERRQHRLSGLRIEPNSYSAELTIEDLHPVLTTCWVYGIAREGVDGASAAGDGMALLTHGSTVTVARAGVKLVDSPAGIDVQDAGPVVQLLANCWPSERHGTLIERSRTNLVVRSSFATLSGGAGSVPTGWTATSGTVASDATVGEQLFVDPTVSANVLLLTDSGADARATMAAATSSVLANTKVCVSIDRKSSSATAGDGGAYRLQRAVDSWYWNATTPAWQPGVVDNVLTPSTSWARHESDPFSVGASNTTLTLQLVHPSTATASSTVRFGHVQIEAGEWVSSRIKNEASATTRPADQISLTNDKSDGSTTYYLWPNTRGSWTWNVTARWNSAEVTAATQFWLQRLPYSNGNRWELYYTVGTGWRFTARSGGVDYTATVNVAVVAGTEYEIRTRWTSSTGEWDKPLTLTLVVVNKDTGAVLGSSEAAYVQPAFTAAIAMTFGEHGTTADRQWDGYAIESRNSPLCPSDTEMGI